MALWMAAGLGLFMIPTPAHAEEAEAEDTAVVSFHFEPVPDLQIAIWLEDAEGNFVQDVYVTQATGKLGIGNRPGIWNFLSSWHFPYGPRTSVLPVWGHRRGKTYPRLVFHDSKENYQDSLGWHETTSSDETYFCRPLTADENNIILDVLSCPSPNAFHSDKGRFQPGETSIYPPRNDISELDPEKDHPDVGTFGEINDLDAITGATPPGYAPTYEVITLDRNVIGDGPLVAYIEVSLEHDENADWDFDREGDHYVDSKLSGYGIEWLGQPSVVYRVEFDPADPRYTATSSLAGFSTLDGSDGTLHTPDGTISAGGGSGADRLQTFTREGIAGRFGVASTGWTADGGTGPDGCSPGPMPAVTDFISDAVDFDRVALTFDVPEDIAAGVELRKVNVYYQIGEEPVDPSNLDAAVVQEFNVCSEAGTEGCDLVLTPGETQSVEVDQLWGNYAYQFALTYEDMCASESEPAATSATTPLQQFQTIDTFCVIATAAWGGSWHDEVAALRGFRDGVLRKSAAGNALVEAYYTYGPSAAWWLSKSDLARGMARVLLQPVADLAAAAGPVYRRL